MTYKEQLADPRWQKKRLLILERDEWTCQVCWDTSTQLHVHHTYYNPIHRAWEYEDDALLTLCKHCHLVEEFLKNKNLSGFIAIKKYSPKKDYTLVCTIATTDDDILTLFLFKITPKNHLVLIKDFKNDTSKYSLQELLNHAKKLL